MEFYGKRLKLLNNKWKEYKKEMWGGVDVIVVVILFVFEDLCYFKFIVLYIWLLGYEFFEIVMVFMFGVLYFVCSFKKVVYFEEL